MQVPADPFFAFLDSRATSGFPDLLTEPDDLRALGFDHPDKDQLAQARELRDRLVEALLRSDTPQLRRDRLNALVETYQLQPRFTADGALVFEARATSAIGSLVARMLGRAVELEQQGLLDHLKTCAADTCVVPFVDTSPSHRRRYCSPTCATRMRVRRHRSEQAPGGHAK